VGGYLAQIIPRIELENWLKRLKAHPDPDPSLEQYTTPPKVAAEMLFTAAYIHDDVRDKIVADLGCGTGRLGIGALLLGSRALIGVDIDPRAISVAVENAKTANVAHRCHWIIASMPSTRAGGIFDTVLMNPPFGTRVKHLDVVFLSQALKLANIVYSLHKSSTRRFIMDYVHRKGGRVSCLLRLDFEIPMMFSFHEKAHKRVEIDLYRIVHRSIPSRVFIKRGSHIFRGNEPDDCK
jgi:putative methylase